MDFQLPELGEGVYEAELVAWKVQPGDVVKRGQILMEALTDKATMEGPAPAERQPQTPRMDYGTPGTRIKLAGVRRKIAERMVQSKRTVPHYSYVDECDVTELVRLREGLREAYRSKGVHITYLPFIIKA